MYVPPVPAQPGDEVYIPVRITDVTGLGVISADLAITYDPEEVEFVSASLEGAITEGWHVAYHANSGAPAGLDTVRIAMATAREPLTGMGPLVFLWMGVSGEAVGDTLALDIVHAVLNDGLPAVEGIPSDRIVLGDASGNGRVSALDASLILRYVVGSIILPDAVYPAFTAYVADVSGNGRITAFDASLILRYVVGLLDRFPVEGGYLVQTKVASALRLAEMEEADDGVLVVPIVVEEMAGISSGEMTMYCDAEQFEVVEVREAPLIDGFLSASRVDADTVRFCFAGAEPRQGSGRIVEVILRRRSANPGAMGGVELIAAQMNEEPVEIERRTELPPVPEVYRLSQNCPNPFNGRTVFAYDVSRAESVEIVIFNAEGQWVRTLVDEVRSPGIHVAVWDGTDDEGHRMSTGVYLCRMRTASFAATRKVLLIR